MNHMLRIIICLFILLPTSTFAGNNADRLYSTGLFSIIIPAYMEIDDSDENKVSLIFKDDINLQLGTISISATKYDKPFDGEEAWKKMRPYVVSEKTIISESKIEFARMVWQNLSLTEPSDSCQLKDVAYYTYVENVTFWIHYHCQIDNCDEIGSAFNEIVKSFRVK